MFRAYVYRQSRPESIEALVNLLHLAYLKRDAEFAKQLLQVGVIVRQQFAHVVTVFLNLILHLCGARKKNIVFEVNVLVQIRLKLCESSV